MKNVLHDIIDRLDIGEKRFSELEHILIETTESEKQWGKRTKEKHKTGETKYSKLWYNWKEKYNTYWIRIPEEERERNGRSVWNNNDSRMTCRNVKNK